MKSQEIIKYYKPSIIRFIILAIKRKEDEAIKKLWDLGWFTPEEYNDYKKKNLSYKQMMTIYNIRKRDWARAYISRSYSEGYLDEYIYNSYLEFYNDWQVGRITDDQMSQAMFIVLIEIKNNRKNNRLQEE